MDDASGPGSKTRMPEEKPSLFERRMLLAVYQQNWENARHIKNERLSFTNIYCIVAAGLLSFLHTVTGKRELDGERVSPGYSSTGNGHRTKLERFVTAI